MAPAIQMSGSLANNRSSLPSGSLQKNHAGVRSGHLLNFTNSVCSDTDNASGAGTNSKDPQAPKLLLNSEKVKALNSSASPSTKISIRTRKGASAAISNGNSAQGMAGPGLEMLPSTPKTFKRTKRVLFARRMNFMDRPVLIITF